MAAPSPTRGRPASTRRLARARSPSAVTPHGGTKIAVSGHGFFKDFTVKDGNIIENHGGHGAMSSEVKVHQVVWMADSGKTLPREYAFTIKTGDHEQIGQDDRNLARDRRRLAAGLVPDDPERRQQRPG